MRLKLLIPLLGAIALTAVCASTTRADTPAIKAKKAEAARVLNEVGALDERLNAISEQYDGANVRLGELKKSLAVEQTQLARAQSHYRAAELRAAKLAVWLYTSSHSSSLDVILGATSLQEMLRLSDAEYAISRQATTITLEASTARRQLQARVKALAHDRAAQRATVRELASRRNEIQRGLKQRTRLLVSVQGEVDKLEAAERARQARLAAAARARLQAELAARAKAQAAEAARERAAAAAAAKAAAAKQAAAAAAASAAITTQTTPSVSTTTLSVATPTVATPTLTAPATTSDVPTVTQPTGPLPAGYPQAAQLALSYLGVPYVWGGSSPSGFDCSGLVSYVYAQIGVQLPHFAAAQYTYGVPVTQAQLQPGDLVFFDGLDHVGIYLGDNEFINAPHTGTLVRIDSLSEDWYTKHYVGARRI